MSAVSEEIVPAGNFFLPESMRLEIISHARREAPRECCGIISGREAESIRLYPTRNIAAGNALYEIDPAELIHLEFHEMPSQQTELLAIYHSHPVSPAYPSPTDVALAFWPEAIYVICSLADPETPIVRAFRIHEGVVSEVALDSSPALS